MLLVLALVTAALLMFGIHVRRFQPVRFTPDMLARIDKGMTEAEVVAILGKPAGDYADPATCFLVSCPDWRSKVWAHPQGWPRKDGLIEKAWISDELGISVVFNTEGRVVDRGGEEMFVPPSPSFFDIIRQWLR
jgi:hypothetical protein